MLAYQIDGKKYGQFSIGGETFRPDDRGIVEVERPTPAVIAHLEAMGAVEVAHDKAGEVALAAVRIEAFARDQAVKLLTAAAQRVDRRHGTLKLIEQLERWIAENPDKQPQPGAADGAPDTPPDTPPTA